MEQHLDNGSMDYASRAKEDASPTSSAPLWSTLDPGRRLQFDSTLYNMRAIETGASDIDSYVELDPRLGWKVKPGLEFSLIGQNLLDSHHSGFLPAFFSARPTEVEHSIHGGDMALLTDA